jgi:hypothetical protein
VLSHTGGIEFPPTVLLTSGTQSRNPLAPNTILIGGTDRANTAVAMRKVHRQTENQSIFDPNNNIIAGIAGSVMLLSLPGVMITPTDRAVFFPTNNLRSQLGQISIEDLGFNGTSIIAQSGANSIFVDASRQLIDEIVTKRASSVIDPENVTVANAGMRDAITLVRKNNLGGVHLITLSEDGILGLQWQRGDRGVALIFAGDGFASIAFRRPGQYYAENGIESQIDDHLPKEFYDALESVTVQ